MAELRQNLATREWVIIASDRARRPTSFVSETPKVAPPAHDPQCPFCPGREDPELYLAHEPPLASASEPGPPSEWQVRVVRNKYPALRPDGAYTRVTQGIHRQISGVGHHEVLIQNPRHDTCLAAMSEDAAHAAFRMLQARARGLAEDERIAHVALFENHGPRAGASLIHPHAQIMGVPVVPHDVRNRILEARSYFDDTGDCVICRMLDEELEEEIRLVERTEHFTAFVPYAAYSPFHIWVVPRQHGSSFLRIDAERLADLARIMVRTLRRVHRGLDDPDYNYVIRSAPLHEETSPYLHWYVAIVPRVSQPAGFELGSGMFINSALPEESAAFLRSVGVD